MIPPPDDPFAFFGAIYCVNLERRTDRWARISREFERIGIADRVERFAAIEGADPVAACAQSHIEVVRRAEARGVENVLIFEDDAVFPGYSAAALTSAIARLDTLPWDLFLLGARPLARPVERYPDLVRTRFVQSHAYAVHRRAFARIQQSTVPLDVWYAYNLRAYCARPPQAEQSNDDFSDIDGRVRARGEIMWREWRLFVETPYPVFAARLAARSIRRALGRAAIRGARRFGITLEFERGRPRIVR